MRVVLQRVKKAWVSINNNIVSSIDQGLLVLIGIEELDTEEDSLWLANKVSQLRVFCNEEGLMNKSGIDIDGEIMVVSQFTLHARIKKGNRPSYIKSDKPDIAIPLYERFINDLSNVTRRNIKSGRFGSDMQISLVNDGPVTIIIDTKNKE